jgi:hypothetical protein
MTVELEKYFDEFLKITPEFYEYSSDKAVWAMSTLAQERLEQTGNPPSVSLFIHCFEDLKAAGLERIREPLGPEPKNESNMTTDEFHRYYNSLSADQVRVKYGNNPDFRRQVDCLIALKRI